jgi:hypothetical protein
MNNIALNREQLMLRRPSRQSAPVLFVGRNRDPAHDTRERVRSVSATCAGHLRAHGPGECGPEARNLSGARCCAKAAVPKARRAADQDHPQLDPAERARGQVRPIRQVRAPLGSPG